jgi:hypothetical protein
MIPWRVQQALRPAALSAGLLAFRSGLRGPGILRALNIGWDNDGWGADTAYLEAMCRLAQQVRGPILECGSGLSTLLLGIVAPGRVTSLEHIPEWQRRVEQSAARRSIGVNIVAAPLVSHGGFDWYRLPDSLPHNFELVVCDGPPSATRGGRYGLLPVAKRLLAPHALILMDDFERAAEQSIVDRWGSEFGVDCDTHRSGDSAYAVVDVP